MEFISRGEGEWRRVGFQVTLQSRSTGQRRHLGPRPRARASGSSTHSPPRPLCVGSNPVPLPLKRTLSCLRSPCLFCETGITDGNYETGITREGLEQGFSRGHCSISAGYCHLSVHTPPRRKPPRLPFSSDTRGRCSRAPRSLPQRLRRPTWRSGGIRGLAPAPPLGPHNVQHF